MLLGIWFSNLSFLATFPREHFKHAKYENLIHFAVELTLYCLFEYT